ncbi:hypothetical protein SDC9_197422 [bioreactor metagenome]|uniref:Uncharacterized protein n=1 Tax=bioreactor metagenome TaxID=1076179 RepID=A0A645IFB0_9ZZZZ
MTCANVLRDRRRHNTDWTRTGHQYIFPNQIERQCRVHCITERIEDRRQVVGDIVRDFKCVKCRDHQVLRKAARTVYTDTGRIAAQVSTSTAAVTAMSAGDMTFA